MGKRDQIKLLKAIVEDSKRTTNPTSLALGKVCSELLGQKNATFPASKIIQDNDGCRAHLNTNLALLEHRTISDIAHKKVLKQNHPYFQGSPELIVQFPLETTEGHKRDFLKEASKHFKALYKFGGKKIKSKKGEIRWEAKEIPHRHPKGKRTDPVVQSERIKRIKKSVDALKVRDVRKITDIFEEVGKSICESEPRFFPKELKPATVRNLYYTEEKK